jgi:hypothetical protein
MITALNLFKKPAVNMMAHTVEAGPALARTGVVLSLFNGSGKPKRPMSNLLDTKVYPLAKSNVTSLIALFKMGSKSWRDVQLWSAVTTEVLKPEFPFNNLKKVMKQHRQMLPVISKAVTESLGAAKFAKVTLTATGAEVSIPVISFTTDMARMMGAVSTSQDAATQFFTNNSITVEEKEVSTDALKFAYVEGKDANILRALHGKFRIVQSGSMYRLFIEVTLNREQVAYLCNTDFDNVRVIDLYGLVRTWAQGRTNASIDLPKTTKPLADIAATIPVGGEPRTNKDGILIDTDATLLYLPKEVNNISRYDIAMATELLNPDGSMSQAYEDKVKKLPGMQNVLIDWVNKKWSYVNGEGNLEIRDLSRAQPLNVTQIRGFIMSPMMGNDKLQNFMTRVSSLSGKVGGSSFSSLAMFVSDGLRLLNLNPDYEGTLLAEFALYHVYELAKMWKECKTNPQWEAKEKELLQFQHFCDTVAKLVTDIKKNEDAYFAIYSVLTISSFLAACIVFTEYAGQHMQIIEADRQARAKYMAAPIDTAYQAPALPYMADARGLMPHQHNVGNMLRDSPDNAILAVQAGGGKTAIIVTDILKEMAQGVKGPFLVLCPAHLVSQYVQEFTYFTNGKVNVVAVNHYTLKNIGYAGLEKMIEAAPINTIVIADYNLAKGSKTLNIGYGTSSTQVFRVVEFLRQFNFQYAALDESHKVKNPSATQTQAISTLVIDIPKKRLASGTFMDNSPSDIAGQFSLLDPTVFGSVENFNTQYSANGTPGKIRQMKPGAELDILRKLKDNCRYVSVKRKEWAAVLPPRIESMDHFVEMSHAQKEVYDSILNISIQELMKAAEKNKDLAKLLGVGQFSNMDSKEREETLDELDDEDQTSEMSGGLDELLRPYLARLEQFLVAPSRDKLGASLQGDDRNSPKVAELVKIFREHTGAKIPGKILVFTNQTASAEELYNALPADVKARTIAYTAGQKEACGAEFATNPEKDMMIGVSQSMDTGLNLQFCSRLIRCETVMSPGALEQGNSRIGRPNVKATETRPATYYDWILCSGTIDITKVAYLLTKKVRIASVEEAANPAYTDLEVPELFNLSLDNIRENNTKEALAPYLGPDGMYRKFLMCEKDDYDTFRNQNKHLLDPAGRLKMVKLEKGADLPGSAIMRRIPYVPGLNLYGADQLGLVRLDQYLQLNEVAVESDESESEEDENPVSTGDEAEDAALTKRREFMGKVLGLKVHIDAGEGEITGAKFRVGKVRVKLSTGEVVYASILSTFVITKPQTSGRDVRGALAKMSGSIPIDTPIDVPDVKKVMPSKKVIKEVVEQETVDKHAYVALDLLVNNDIIGLTFKDPASDKKTAKILEAMKFVPTPPNYYAKLLNPQTMLRFFKKLQASGYTMPKQQSELLANFYTKWLGMRANATSLFGMANATQQKNFYLLTHKPNPDKKMVNAFISTENGVVYLRLPSMGNKGNTTAVRNVQVSGVKFYVAKPQLTRYFNSPMEAVAFLKKLDASGLVLTNEAELHKSFGALRREIPKATKKSMEQFFGQ